MAKLECPQDLLQGEYVPAFLHEVAGEGVTQDGPNQSLGLGYSGEMGDRTQNHEQLGQWQMSF